MSIYIALYLLLALLGIANWSRSQLNFFHVLLFILLVVFVGTRLDTGCDFDSYSDRFKLLKLEYSSFSNITEPGYFLLTFLIKKAGLDFVWVNIVGASLFFYYLFKFARNHPRPIFVVALTFPILIVQLSMSGLRQALAVAFLMGALDAFMKGRRTQVVVYILIGSTFHQSAIILLPLAMMVGRTFSLLRVATAIVALMPVALYLLSDRIGVYRARYIEELYGEMSSGGVIYRLGLIVITAICFELYRNRFRLALAKEYNLMQVFSLVSFALIPAMLVNTVAVHRMIYYVIPIHAYILAALPTVILTGRRATYLGALVPIALYGAYIVVWLSISRHAEICYIPYDSYLY